MTPEESDRISRRLLELREELLAEKELAAEGAAISLEEVKTLFKNPKFQVSAVVITGAIIWIIQRRKK